MWRQRNSGLLGKTIRLHTRHQNNIPGVQFQPELHRQKINRKTGKGKKKNLERRRHFTPFIATTDGMLGKEAKNFVARLVDRLAGKWMSPYSQVMAYVRGRISMAILRGTSRRIRGTRTPFPLERLLRRRNRNRSVCT